MKNMSNLKIRIYQISAFAFFISLLIMVLLGRFAASERSEALTESLRNDIFVNDLREVAKKLHVAVSQSNFVRVSVEDSTSANRTRKWIEPEALDFSYSVPILLNVKDPMSVVTTLTFTYSIGPFLRNGVLFWLCIVMFLLLLIPQLKKNIELDLSRKHRRELESKLFALAQKVAHDIRSPLSALNIIAASFTDIEGDRRNLLNSVVKSINEIADDLLLEVRSVRVSNDNVTSEEVHAAPYAGCLLRATLNAVVQEKKLEFQNRADIKIECSTGRVSAELIVPLSELVLKRAISNLVNNAVEAITNIPEIYIDAYEKSGEATIVVSDYGKGIPENILKKLGNEEISYGKNGSASGSGIGFKSVQEAVAFVGGTVAVASKIGQGTKVTLTIPTV